MKDYIEERAIELAKYIIENKATVRAAAGKFGVSKSTVHKDVSERIGYVHSDIAREVKRILENNKEERHLRGGYATRAKYLKMSK